MQTQELLNHLKPLLIQNEAFTIEDAAKLLPLGKTEISSQLVKLYRSNIIVRLKRGLYLPVQNQFLATNELLTEPFRLIPSFFPGTYIDGWSACSQHGLTDQIFSDICLFSSKSVFKRNHIIYGHHFVLFANYASTSWGVSSLWDNNDKLQFADVHRSIIDIFIKPAAGGGIRNIIDCFKEYIRKYEDCAQLIRYLNNLDNGSLFKRLGYISEAILGSNHPLPVYCFTKITKGYIPIDPNIYCTKLITKWNIFVYKDIKI